jgi:hypothetical protein
MSYLYKTILFIDTTNVVPIPPDNTADLADFEDNHKADCVPVDEVALAGTTFTVWQSFEDFDASIDGDVIVWGDVKCIETEAVYVLNLLTNNPL